MSNDKINISRISPVLMAFFVMSFVDLVGIGVDRVSKDMNLSATVAQLIPSAAFLWFFVLSVPVGVMQSRLGKKNMLNIGRGAPALGLVVHFFTRCSQIASGLRIPRRRQIGIKLQRIPIYKSIDKVRGSFFIIGSEL